VCKSGSWVSSWNVSSTEVFNLERSVVVIFDGCKWLLWVVQDLRMVCQLSCLYDLCEESITIDLRCVVLEGMHDIH